jgi:acyl dehydratase
MGSWQGWGRALATLLKRPSNVTALPPVQLALPEFRLDAGHMARYAAVCGFANSDQVPLTYPQVLAFPLVLHYMTSPACPWPAMGTVHLGNSITQHEPLRVGEAVRIELSTGQLLAHDKGQAFALNLRLHNLSTGRCAWQATQTLLRVGVRQPCGEPWQMSANAPQAQHEPQPPDTAWQAIGQIVAKADIGRRYAAVSGDHNPIHLYALTAKLFGFRRALAHGLWTQARLLSMVQADGVLPRASLLAVFKRPLLLPATATVWQAKRLEALDPDNVTLLEVRDQDGVVPHLHAQLKLNDPLQS